MQKKDVFISYKAEELEYAKWVESILEDAGISCWMAPACIPGGSSYASEIPQAIRQTSVFVLVLSSQAQLSRWVSREVDIAINEGKIIMPFMIENCKLKDDFAFYLTNVQAYYAFEDKTAAMDKMLNDIKAVVGLKAEKPVQIEIPKETPEEVAPIPSEPVVEIPVKPVDQLPKTESSESENKNIVKVTYDMIGIVGFVTALISAVMALFVFEVGVISIISIVLSVLGIVKIEKEKKRARKLSIAGLVLGIFALATTIFLWFWW